MLHTLMITYILLRVLVIRNKIIFCLIYFQQQVNSALAICWTSTVTLLLIGSEEKRWLRPHTDTHTFSHSFPAHTL